MSVGTMQTPPTSHVECSRSPSVASSGSRPRTMSDVSAASRLSQLTRTDLRDASETATPLRPPTVVDRGTPPMNKENQYICDVSPECAHLTFNRKCEWSKHMDKHDRPYRCRDTMCAKLQGFTYSGGLLRHEREVHNKHGGPKEKLYCPFEDCKRHDGSGFTRRENLNEHVRRVHEKRKSDASLKAENGTATAWPPEQTRDASPPVASLASRKRQWDDIPSPEASEGEKTELHVEVKRLRAQNDLLQEQMNKLRGELDSFRAASRSPLTGGFRPI